MRFGNAVIVVDPEIDVSHLACREVGIEDVRERRSFPDDGFNRSGSQRLKHVSEPEHSDGIRDERRFAHVLDVAQNV